MKHDKKFRSALVATAMAVAQIFSWGDYAYAQSQGVRQSGQITVTHVPCWTYNGIIQDCGPSTLPFATSFGLYGTGTPFCILNTQITTVNQNTQPYYQLCMGYATGSTAGVISLTPFNGAANIGLNLIIDGVTYTIGGSSTWLSTILDQQFGSTPGDILCRSSSAWVALSPGASGQFLQAQSAACPLWVTPGSTFNNPIRIISSGTTDTATSTDGTVAWNSASASAKSQTIYACAAGVNGRSLIIKDEKGTAGTYNVTITPVSGTIDNASNFTLQFNLQSVTLQCDGTNTNWLVL